MTISTRADLHTAIDDYSDRSYTEARKNIFVSNAEAKFNRTLVSTFRRTMDTTLTTNSSGQATLPSGFAGLSSIVRAVTGSVPLIQVGWDALISLNPYSVAGDPTHYAIKASTLQVAPIAEDSFTTVFKSTLTPLTSSNATNWLLSLAPDIYLNMCLAEEATFTRDFATAQGFAASAYSMLDDLISMDTVAAFGNAELTLDMPTP